MSEKKTEELFREVNGIVDKQRELAEKYGADSAQYKTYMEKADAKMEEFEKKNTEMVAEHEKAKETNEELLGRVKHLETLSVNAKSVSDNPEQLKKDTNAVMSAMLSGKSAWFKFVEDEKNLAKAGNVMTAISKGDCLDGNDAFEFNRIAKAYGEKASQDVLRSDIGELGGYLCPPEWSNELNKNMIEYAPLRSFCRVKTTRSKTYKEPIRVGIPRATWPGETVSSGANTSSVYALNEWSPVRLTNTTGVTHDELAYNAYNLAGELMQDNAEAFAVAEGQAFFDGDGIEKPIGWSVDNKVPEFISGGATVDFDDFIEITGELKRGYDPMFMFNRRTLAQLRLLKDGSSRYLWNPAFGDAASGAPATINGFRYNADFIEFDDLDAGTGSFPILFADMTRFYQMVDRADMTVIRDEYSRKKEGIVEFTWNKWTFGKPKIHEAGIRMKVGS